MTIQSRIPAPLPHNLFKNPKEEDYAFQTQRQLPTAQPPHKAGHTAYSVHPVRQPHGSSQVREQPYSTCSPCKRTYPNDHTPLRRRAGALRRLGHLALLVGQHVRLVERRADRQPGGLVGKPTGTQLPNLPLQHRRRRRPHEPQLHTAPHGQRQGAESRDGGLQGPRRRRLALGARCSPEENHAENQGAQARCHLRGIQQFRPLLYDRERLLWRSQGCPEGQSTARVLH